MGFISVLKKIGQDIEKVFASKPFQVGEQLAETVVGLAFPGIGPLFNLTAQAVMTTEQNFAAVGKQSGTGQEKLAAVLTAAGNLIAQGLKDAGVSNVTQDKVAGYISAVVTVLNAAPVPAPAAPAPAAG
jgi:hypothetical protein